MSAVEGDSAPASGPPADVTNLSSGHSSDSQQALHEQVTPYKLLIILLIEHYWLNRRKISKEKALGGNSPVNNLTEERRERDFMFGLLQTLQVADLEFSDFISKVKSFTDKKSFLEILEGIGKMRSMHICEEMDMIERVCSNLGSVGPDSAYPMSSSGELHRSSVIGFFVRRMELSNEKMNFSQVTRLHNKFMAYCSDWERYKVEVEAELNPFDGNAASSIREFTSKAGVTDHLNSSVLDTGCYSRRQAEFFIAKQASLLQHSETDALPAKKLQQNVYNLIASNPELAESHFLSYLNQMRAREYCGSLDSLFHYFDRQGSYISDKLLDTAQKSADTKAEESTPSKGFRYAALNLASMHYRFGHYNEALGATCEAIKMAQETNDHVCLQHTLCWLQKIGEYEPSTSVYLLDRLVTRALELNLPHLTSLGVLESAKHHALVSTPPSRVFEFMLRSDMINCQHSLQDLACASLTQRAALWSLYGFRDMCSVISQRMLMLCGDQYGASHSEDSECLSLCHLAKHHASLGEIRVADELISHCKHRFAPGSTHAHIWQLVHEMIIFERSLNRGERRAAELAISNIASCNVMEAQLCQARLHFDYGESNLAFTIIQDLKSVLEENNNPNKCIKSTIEFKTRLLLLESEVFCGISQPSQAIPPLLKCLTLAKEHHMFKMSALCRMQLAHIQLILKMPAKATRLMELVISPLLSSGSLEEQAKALFLYVCCRVASVSSAPEPQRKRVLESSIKLLIQTVDLLEKVESHHRLRNVLYYQTRLYHELGLTSERNKCALEFQQIDLAHPDWNQPKTIFSF